MSGTVLARRQRRTTSNRAEHIYQARQPTCWLGCFSGGRREGSEDDDNRDRQTQALEAQAGRGLGVDSDSGGAGGDGDPAAAQGNVRSTGQYNHAGGRTTAIVQDVSGDSIGGHSPEACHAEAHQFPAATAVPCTTANLGAAPGRSALVFQAAAALPQAFQQVSQVGVPSGGILTLTFEQSGSNFEGQPFRACPNPVGAAPPIGAPPSAHSGLQPIRIVSEIEALSIGSQPPMPKIHRVIGHSAPPRDIRPPANPESVQGKMEGTRSMEEMVPVGQDLNSGMSRSSISGCGLAGSSSKGDDRRASAQNTAGKSNAATTGSCDSSRGLSGGHGDAGSGGPHGKKPQAQRNLNDGGRHQGGVVGAALDKSLLSYVKLREKSLLSAAFGSEPQAVATSEHRDLQMSSAARYCDPAAMRCHPASMLERVVGRAAADLRSRGHLDRHSVKLVRPIGSGAFGSVYFGLWQGAPVAVKVLLLEDENGFVRQHRAMLEAAIGAALDHPNVAATYAYDCLTLTNVDSESRDLKGPMEGGGVGRPPGMGTLEAAPRASGPLQQKQPQQTQQQNLYSSTAADAAVHKLYIVQEFCSGGSLKEMLTAHGYATGDQSGAGNSSGLLTGGVLGGGAAAAAALSFAFDVACGLRHVHAARVVHGDVSCGNVLLTFRQCEHNKPTTAAVGKGNAAAMGPPNGFGCPSSLSAAQQPAAIKDEEHTRGDPAVRGVDEKERRWRQRLEGLSYRPPPLIAKVADFGLSMWLNGSRSHASGMYQGTPLYVAPEVYGWGRVSRASDVYSYGVLLLELVYGKNVTAIWQDYHQRQQRRQKDMRAEVNPIQLPSLDAAALGGHGSGCSLLLYVLRMALTDEPDCPTALRELVAVCLAVCPSHRPSFDQIAAELVNIMEGFAI